MVDGVITFKSQTPSSENAGGRLYAIFTTRPNSLSEGLEIRSLRKSKIKSVTLLKNGKALKYASKIDNEILVYVEDDDLDSIATVIAVNVETDWNKLRELPFLLSSL